MLFGDYVLDVVNNGAVVLSEQTILTAVIRSPADGRARLNRDHLVPLGSNDAARFDLEYRNEIVGVDDCLILLSLIIGK